MNIDKAIVLNRFSKALITYDQEATVQQLVAAEMLDLIQEAQPGFAPHRVLELGCGTGFLSSLIAQQYGKGITSLTLNDIVPEARQVVQERLAQDFNFLLGDAERIPWVEHQDLVISNCSIQWWDNMTHYFRKGLQYTHQGAIVAASIFAQGHFWELQSILPQSLHYPTYQEISTQLEGLGYEQITIRGSSRQLEFPHLLALLKHIKATGANAFTQQVEGSWTPLRLQQLERLMREERGLSDSAPLTLTYKPLIIIAKR